MVASHCTALILITNGFYQHWKVTCLFIKIYEVNYFLAKSEPGVYSISDLERDKTTTWDGIKNPQALQAVRAMRPNDRVFIYHSGGKSEIVGLAEVIGDPRTDPKNPKSAIVELKFLSKLDPPTSLSDVKTSGLFNDWALVRQSRLSTMQAPQSFVAWIRNRYPHLKI
jgi:predicted RNA-binding protein with PUA-like domain